MSVLFLLEAAKKTDAAFQLTPRSSAHTVCSSKKDVESLTKHLLDKNVAREVEGRVTPAFVDPSESGWQKLCTTSWLQERLSASDLEEELDHDTEGCS